MSLNPYEEKEPIDTDYTKVTDQELITYVTDLKREFTEALLHNTDPIEIFYKVIDLLQVLIKQKGV